MNVLDFIKQHTHINYCEAVIYPNGEIEYSIPSHEQKLIAISNKSIDELRELMPIEANPIAWLVDYTKCVAVYYDYAFIPDDFTDEQKYALRKLKQFRIISNSFTIQQLFEKQIVDYTHNNKDVQSDEIKRICSKRYIGVFK